MNQKVAENKEVKKQMDFLKKEFANDSNFEWMNETQNRIKTDKKTLSKLKDENQSLVKMLEKHERLLEKSDEAVSKNADLTNMKEQLG